MYTRRNWRVCFLTPTIAVGIDEDDRPFFEVAWFWFVIGFGDTP